uniref:Uncharacterized protein n=1 Tax=Plectus sambesii TaxID=2011161 RepID=A0A914V3F9_9BILA
MSKAPKPRSQCNRRGFVVAPLPINPGFAPKLEVQVLISIDRLIKVRYALHTIKADSSTDVNSLARDQLTQLYRNGLFANGRGAQLTVGQNSRWTIPLAHWISPLSTMCASSAASSRSSTERRGGRPKHEECRNRIGLKLWAPHILKGE